MQLVRFDAGAAAHANAVLQPYNEIDEAIHHYIGQCNRVLELTHNARSAENWDTHSDNRSLFGIIASTNSRSHNYAASDAVNALEHEGNALLGRLQVEHETQEQLRIQHIAAEASIARRLIAESEPGMPVEQAPIVVFARAFTPSITTAFGGSQIRASEDNEHTFGAFFTDVLRGDDRETSNRSAMTARVISDVANRVRASRNQAITLFEQRNPGDFRYRIVNPPTDSCCKSR